MKVLFLPVSEFIWLVINFNFTENKLNCTSDFSETEIWTHGLDSTGFDRHSFPGIPRTVLLLRFSQFRII